MRGGLNTQFWRCRRCRNETVICVTGEVVPRSDETINSLSQRRSRTSDKRS